ncbi:TPA_asm: maturation protein [ssRNA phage ESE005]|uniref:Maturation protein n=1 Tax=ssRNA phage ESE005 TaxID=2785995 RepID=A0A8S5KXU6_9VIRU|nr:maturation protein [ssRNA phage ESE005]DAD49877.1 TPA_asm: maturation protein [ssRNA phage ESE005]
MPGVLLARAEGGLSKMTTGSNTIDGTVATAWYDSGDYGGVNPTGRWKTRSWSGGDSPARERIARDLADGVAVRYLDRRGKERYFYSSQRPPKRSRRLEEHAYSMSAHDEFHPSCNLTLVGDYGGTRTFTGVTPFRLYGGYSAPIGPNGGFAGSSGVQFTANDDINLINRLKTRIRGSDFNMGVFLGEGHETLAMIGDAALTIASSLRSLRKGDVYTATRTLLKNGKPLYRGRLNRVAVRRGAVDQLSNNLLALNWGWIPLLQDMRSGAELLAQILNVPFSMRSRVAIVKRSPHNFPTCEMAGGWIRSKQIIAILSEPESIPKMLGLTDPLSIAWELTPFSMLADYVVPIGSWLEARAFASGLTGKFITTSILRCDARDISFGKTYERVPGYPSHMEGDTKGAYLRYINLDRSVSTSLSVPKPVVKPLDKVFSVRHCINALALLAQVAKGPLKSDDDKLLTKALDLNPTRRQLRSQLKAGDAGSFRFM